MTWVRVLDDSHDVNYGTRFARALTSRRAIMGHLSRNGQFTSRVNWHWSLRPGYQFTRDVDWPIFLPWCVHYFSPYPDQKYHICFFEQRAKVTFWVSVWRKCFVLKSMIYQNNFINSIFCRNTNRIAKKYLRILFAYGWFSAKVLSFRCNIRASK